MESVVYLVRPPLDESSPLLSSGDNSAIVIAVEKSLSAGKVLKSAVGFPWEKGNLLSYKELLELLLRSHRVITL